MCHLLFCPVLSLNLQFLYFLHQTHLYFSMPMSYVMYNVGYMHMHRINTRKLTNKSCIMPRTITQTSQKHSIAYNANQRIHIISHHITSHHIPSHHIPSHQDHPISIPSTPSCTIRPVDELVCGACARCCYVLSYS